MQLLMAVADGIHSLQTSKKGGVQIGRRFGHSGMIYSGDIAPDLGRITWRMWMLLQVHAKQCQNNDCPVPRCRELREMRRRAVARQEDQRRVAYQAMLRNQNGQAGGGGSGSQGGGKGSGGGSGSQAKHPGGEIKRESQY